ncbi:MAG: transcription antitermination factor NusB [Coriobacteriales bacterium]|jgi:N utilization substance protein B|nr:transcription antitermination factor NusB [Coriobacteriales bacterium]
MDKPGEYQTRKAARRKALQLLYQATMSGEPVERILSEELYLEEVGVPCEFTKMLLIGTMGHLKEIDAYIARTSANWKIDRMPLVDLGVLRMATFELLYVDEVPFGVSINEAVELAKHFGCEDESSRFVNGVLGRIARELDELAADDAGCGALPDAEVGITAPGPRQPASCDFAGLDEKDRSREHG